MQYRKDPKSGNRLSALGFGCMRLPRKHGAIDQEESTALIQKAIEDGVNYFDTAYMYAGSEETLGRALQGGLREKIYIADKMPPPLCRNAADFDKLLHKMLDRLGTDYIDYLLIHMLTDVETWNRLCGLGIEDWIRTQKQAGRSSPSCWRHIIGIFAKSNITISMKIIRQGAAGCKRRMSAGCP